MASTRENAVFIKDLISERLLDEAIEWIKDNLAPDEVFDVGHLNDWAADNGFVRGEQ